MTIHLYSISTKNYYSYIQSLLSIVMVILRLSTTLSIRPGFLRVITLIPFLHVDQWHCHSLDFGHLLHTLKQPIHLDVSVRDFNKNIIHNEKSYYTVLWSFAFAQSVSPTCLSFLENLTKQNLSVLFYKRVQSKKN